MFHEERIEGGCYLVKMEYYIRNERDPDMENRITYPVSFKVLHD